MITLYPPILNNIPAFTKAGIHLTYQIPSVNNINNIASVLVLIRKQKNNQLIHSENVPINDKGTILISDSELFNQLVAGDFIKIQLRFIGVDNKQSELSNVSVSKYLEQEPEIYITNLKNNAIINASGYLFYGQMNIENSIGERPELYQFTLYDENGIMLEESGWITHDSSKSDQWVFDTALEDNTFYQVGYQVQTQNGYLVQEKFYNFMQKDIAAAEESSLQISAVSAQNITLTLSSINPLSNWFVIRRKKDDGAWKDIKYIYIFRPEDQAQDGKYYFTYVDHDVEFGSCYQYTINKEFHDGKRVEYARTSEPLIPDFEHTYLYRDGKQFCLMYNPQISQWNSTVIDSEIQTLGRRYPVIIRNGTVKYKKFNISGTISVLSDDEKEFFDTNVKLYGKAEVNHSIKNIYNEREFRELVNDWLTDGEFKLFKSPTEHNAIVYCQNVQITPNRTLGRLIADVSMTLIEVVDYTVANVDKYGIEPIGYYDINALQDQLIFGQLLDVYDIGDDLWDKIRKQVEGEDASNNYNMLQALKEIKIYTNPQNEFSINGSTIVIPVSNFYQAEDVNQLVFTRGRTRANDKATIEVQYIGVVKTENYDDYSRDEYIAVGRDTRQIIVTDPVIIDENEPSQDNSPFEVNLLQPFIEEYSGIGTPEFMPGTMIDLRVEAYPGTKISLNNQDNQEIVIGHTYVYQVEVSADSLSLSIISSQGTVYIKYYCTYGVKTP